MLKQVLHKKLSEFYNEDVERVGFVLNDGEVVEVPNVSNTPERGFDVSPEDVMKYGDIALSTWHTHPKATFNLSAIDMQTFLNWSNLSHFIIGNNGVREYVVEDGEVLIA